MIEVKVERVEGVSRGDRVPAQDEVNIFLTVTKAVAVSAEIAAADPDAVARSVGRLLHRTRHTEKEYQEAVLKELTKDE